MSNESPIHVMMKEIGPLLQLQEVLQSTEEPSWSLQWEDGAVVTADYDEEEERVTLSSHVGTMPEQGAGELALLLLRYNALWQETGGVRLGLEDCDIVQMFDFPAPGMDSPVLCHILTDFADKARIWNGLVENHQHAGFSTTSSLGHADDMAELLRSGMRA